MYEELASLGRPFGLRAEVFHGGAAYGPQEGALRQGLDILVATPGRVIDHLQRGNLNLADVQHAVLDEADEMLNMGFADDIESIFSYVNVSTIERGVGVGGGKGEGGLRRTARLEGGDINKLSSHCAA